MASQKRTTIEIERDRAEIAALYLRGKLQSEIADIINASRDYTLSRQMISYDLKRVQEAWLESSIRDFDELRAQELAKIDTLERTYWDAWERSCEDAETRRIVGNAESPNRVSKTSKTQNGNPQFLAGVERCIERRCKLLGLDAPTRNDITSNGEPIGAIRVSGFDV